MMENVWNVAAEEESRQAPSGSARPEVENTKCGSFALCFSILLVRNEGEISKLGGKSSEAFGDLVHTYTHSYAYISAGR